MEGGRGRGREGKEGGRGRWREGERGIAIEQNLLGSLCTLLMSTVLLQ